VAREGLYFKRDKVGQGDLVFGLWSGLVSRSWRVGVHESAFLSSVAFLHILCFNRNPNPVNLKAKYIEYPKSHIRQNSPRIHL